MPPLALIMDDPERTGYSKWDMKLIKAHYINEAFEIDGHPIQVEESPDIIWKAKRRKLRSAEAVEREQEVMSKSKSKMFGVRVVAEPVLRQGAKWPTREAWRDGLGKQAQLNDAGSEKLAKVGAEQEERAKAKLAELGLD